VDGNEAKALVFDLYKSLLRREPADKELHDWSLALSKGRPFVEIFRHFIGSREFQSSTGVRTTFPAGHYYSPVVDPSQIGEHLDRAYRVSWNEIDGIKIDPDAMATIWSENAELIRQTPFTAEAVPGRRYYYGEGPYPLGDAVILRLMIGSHKPKRIVEIGSGYSSACILDCVDEFNLDPFSLTCIEPFPARLRRLLLTRDKINLLESPVQAVDLDVFRTLSKGDILLIDSTHVLKTGSDVGHEIFRILPVLQEGVIVHIHDCQFPFEYPRLWAVQQNFSWNEIYALRAFLMFNSKFEIYFWNSLFAQTHRDLAKDFYPAFLVNPGSAIWLKVQ
jgi:predicted O-methyltransferase YrrM